MNSAIDKTKTSTDFLFIEIIYCICITRYLSISEVIEPSSQSAALHVERLQQLAAVAHYSSCDIVICHIEIANITYRAVH